MCLKLALGVSTREFTRQRRSTSAFSTLGPTISKLRLPYVTLDAPCGISFRFFSFLCLLCGLTPVLHQRNDVISIRLCFKSDQRDTHLRFTLFPYFTSHKLNPAIMQTVANIYQDVRIILFLHYLKLLMPLSLKSTLALFHRPLKPTPSPPPGARKCAPLLGLVTRTSVWSMHLNRPLPSPMTSF